MAHTICAMKPGFDVNKTPLVVVWETNRTSDLNRLERSFSRQSERHRPELNTAEAEKLIAEVADLRPPIFSFAGSDPLRRSDIYQLIESAAYRQLHPALSAEATALMAGEEVLKLKKAGLSRLALGLDGPTQEIQDELSGVKGSFSRTISAMSWASRCLLPIQVNTKVSRRNVKELEDILHVISSFRLAMWNLVFPIPRAQCERTDILSSVECEQVFARIYRMSQKVQFKIKTTEAQHYRRYVLLKRARTRGKSEAGVIAEGIPGILPINEAKGSVFISHTGDVYPSAFLPLSAGNIRDASLADIYRNSELFRKLRDSENLEGKCGNCECREICGGSRARVHAITGELFGEDPSCIYQPKRVKPAKINRDFDADAAAEANASST
jgi:AdoMet-dependent heme synthase